jgi:hypothetical protein
MIMQLHSQGLQTIDGVRAFVAGSQAANFAVTDHDQASRFVADTLTCFGYQQCSRADKEMLRRYLSWTLAIRRHSTTPQSSGRILQNKVNPSVKTLPSQFKIERHASAQAHVSTAQALEKARAK